MAKRCWGATRWWCEHHPLGSKARTDDPRAVPRALLALPLQMSPFETHRRSHRGARRTVPARVPLAPALCPPSTGQGGSRALGSSPGLHGRRWRWDLHRVAASWPGSARGCGGLAQSPSPGCELGTSERLVSERCEEQEGRRKSSNTKQVSGEPKLCCFLLIMKYS